MSGIPAVDLKNTVVSTYWLDSRNGRGRKDPDTGTILNKATDRVRFDFKQTAHSIVGIAVSMVRMSTRIPRLKRNEREFKIIRGPTGGPNYTQETHVFPPEGGGTFSDPNRPSIYSGQSGNAPDFFHEINFDMIGVFDLKFNNNMGTNQVLHYGSYDVNVDVGIVDSPFARRMGFTNFPVNTVTTNVGAVNHTPFTNIIGDLDMIRRADKAHDYRIPDLYLHCNFEVKSEQGERRQNIIYRMLMDDYDMWSPLQGPAIDGVRSVPAYLDKERVVTPIEIETKFIPVNEIILSWHYEDGTLADLNGEEWSLKFEIISAVERH